VRRDFFMEEPFLRKMLEVGGTAIYNMMCSIAEGM
jgi:hypothetical protein